MSSALAAPPLQTPLIDDPKLGYITKVWNTYLLALATRIQTSAPLLKALSLTGQTAAIGVTGFGTGTIAAGIYRVSWHARITTVGSISSSVTVTISYTTGGVACTQSGAAITGNLTTTVQSAVILIKADQGTAVSYSTAYASNAAGMAYALDLALEQVN